MRKRPLYQSNQEVYELKLDALAELEALSALSLIDLYYGDETKVNMEPCVPYAWQFKDEDVFMPSSKGKSMSCFGLLRRDNAFFFRTTTGNVNSAFIIQELESLAFSITKTTFVVLDNAKIHKSTKFREHREVWEKRGLFVFYLPPYSPHLNIIEILWRKLKYDWLKPEDYFDSQALFYTVTQALNAVGHSLTINFSDFGLR